MNRPKLLTAVFLSYHGIFKFVPVLKQMQLQENLIENNYLYLP